MAEHMDLPWTWHAKSADQAHNGSIYHLKRPGHAYAVAMQPRYVDDKQFAADAEFICRAVNSYDVLVSALHEIAYNPCVSADGNSDIARKALASIPRQQSGGASE